MVQAVDADSNCPKTRETTMTTKSRKSEILTLTLACMLDLGVVRASACGTY
jgi:hypothetical protein